MRFLMTAAFGLLFSLSAAAADAPEALMEQLKSLVPGQIPDSVTETPVSGVYEVAYGPQVFYFSADGRYLLRGEMVDLKAGLNLTEQRKGSARLEAIEAIGEKSMLVYAPKGEARHTITVFTDVDCGYCRKLHSGMAEMNELGIKVRYLAFPRAGVGSPTYKTMVSIWCADDPHKAMDTAKAGKPVEPATCDQDLTDHLRLVQDFGLTGTPALVLEDGTLVPGYMPPQQLLQRLEQSKAGG